MTLRAATADDAEAIARVHVAAWRAGYAGLMPAAFLAALSVEQRTAMWLGLLAQPGAVQHAVALNAAGEVVGFGVCGPSRDAGAAAGVGELQALNVLPAEWGHGHGRALCEWAVAQAAASGWQALTLWVVRENQRARALYESLGFTPDGVARADEGRTGEPLHELRYRRTLAVG